MNYEYRADPILGRALEYWIKKRGSRSMPSKRDIDPVEIPRQILPNVQIIEVIDGGARFRYRLVGTASVDAYGKDYTGKAPEEMFSDNRPDFIQKIYRTVCETKRPLFSHNRYYTAKNIDLFAYRIYMPLSDNDVTVNYIFAILRFESAASPASGIWGTDAKLDPAAQYIELIEIDRLACVPAS